ncbi:hypothetical protein HDU93_007223 [Gonapodya sp. JEL0774]|nr:hypothetical protein HDU93_007223 [Gonapodya sp. JEL0774]
MVMNTENNQPTQISVPPTTNSTSVPQYPQEYPPQPYPYPTVQGWHHGRHYHHRKDYNEKRLLDLVGHQFTNEERVALAEAREEYRRYFFPAVIGGVVGGFILARRGFFGRLIMFGGSVFGGVWVGRKLGQLAGSNVLLEQLPPDSPVRKAAREVVEFQFSRGAFLPRVNFSYGSQYPMIPPTSPPPASQFSQPIQVPQMIPTTTVVAGVAAEEIRDSVAKMLADLSHTVASIGREETAVHRDGK